jgi:ADP-ribosylglycohydrolase
MTARASADSGGITSTRARHALLAAVYGDALGWPNEARARAIGKRSRTPSPDLIAWKRRAGGPYASHEVEIPSGTYSDDSQMISCVARSRIRAGALWWRWLTLVELPFWRLYQRGGGSAMLRAAKAWATRKTPWEDDRRLYLGAGGNGAAMRILPHCIAHAKDTDFAKLYDDVFLDAITTHGHPHAILGATLFAFAVWRMLRLTGRLGFGDLVEEIIAGAPDWGRLPDESSALTENLGAARWPLNGEFSEQWKTVFNEGRGYLEQIREALGMGAIFVDAETLKAIGATGKHNGSGLISACASVFLASRYAADPLQGVVTAAFTKGADTDTLASMTGTLLGCTSEGELLAEFARKVRDYEHFTGIADQLVSGPTNDSPSSELHAVRRDDAEKWLDNQITSPSDGPQKLPDHRVGEIVGAAETHTETFAIRELVIQTEDGQVLEVDRLQRRKKGRPPEPLAQQTLPITDPSQKSPRAVAFQPEVLLHCVDLDGTVSFYERLGLRIFEDLRPRRAIVRMEGVLILLKDANGTRERLTVRLRTQNLLRLIARLAERGIPVNADGMHGDPPFVEIKDPDGRTVQLLEQS